MSIAEKLAEYDGLLDCKTDVCHSGHYATFSFFDQKGDLLMRSTAHPVSYEDFEDFVRFPHTKDAEAIHIPITVRGTANRLAISLYTRHGDAVCEDLTLQNEVIQLAPGNTINVEPNTEGFLHVGK